MTKRNSSDIIDTSQFGFWLYLMTDAMLFASFFAVFAVMRNNTYGGPDNADIVSMPYVLVETIFLLTSSFTCGLAVLAAKDKNTTKVRSYLLLTAVFGLAFLAMELYEFSQLVSSNESWTRSGFMSSFFGLVGLHGLHIVVGLVWLTVMLRLITRRGLIESTQRRLSLFSVYWHFLDIIWIFIFTFVYAMGVIN